MPRLPLQILLAITLILAANYYWSPQTAESPDLDTSARRHKLPQTYLEAVRAWTFDEEGKLTDIIEAKRMEQFPRRKLSLITLPKFFAHSDDDRSWSASAAKGRGNEQVDRLMLRKNVVLIHDQSGTRMKTQALDIELENKVASSNTKVTVVQGNNTTVADGMIVRMEDEIIIMKPNVESIYAPLP